MVKKLGTILTLTTFKLVTQNTYFFVQPNQIKCCKVSQNLKLI